MKIHTKIIKIGSVVTTRRHRYLMTVEKIKNNSFICIYFDKDANGIWNILHREKYHISELKFIHK